jgi:peptidoglycan/xylan/chitin deacetylase (PgdA/CDA1 family)
MQRAAAKFVKSVAGRALALSGAYARNFRSKMVVIAFHRVNDDLKADGVTVGSAKFEAFCHFFHRYFRVVPFAEQVAACRNGRDMGGTLSLTFDDGYLDNCTVAAPILRRLGLPATFFITTGFVGTSGFFPPWDRKLPVKPGWMSWDQVRDLRQQGFDIGCHTDTHINMAASSAATIRAELAISKAKLTEQLGVPPELFVYPFGGPHQITPEAVELVREAGFICNASCYGGVNPATPGDPYALVRIGVAEWFATPWQLGLEMFTDSTALTPKTHAHTTDTTTSAATGACAVAPQGYGQQQT